MENKRLFELDRELTIDEPEEDHFPAVPLNLVEALEQQFPDKLPLRHDTQATETAYVIGQVSVVKFLREMSGRRT